MATTSIIAIKLKDSNRDFVNPNNKRQTVMLPNSANYMYISCFYDGYILSGVGDVLLEKYKNYEDVLNIICQGNRSELVTGLKNETYAERGEGWGINKPRYAENIYDIEADSYNYVFENGKWYVRTTAYLDKEIPQGKYLDLKDVKEFLIEKNK